HDGRRRAGPPVRRPRGEGARDKRGHDGQRPLGLRASGRRGRRRGSAAGRARTPVVTVGAVLAAGGRGDRLGADVPKALVLLAGDPLVVHAWRALRDGGVGEVVVAAPAEQVATLAALLPDACVVAGGATRTASVRRALAAISGDVDVVLVHDAA